MDDQNRQPDSSGPEQPDATSRDARPAGESGPEKTVVVGPARKSSTERTGEPPLESPAHPRVSVERERSWVWPLISLIGLVTVVLMNFLANWLPLNDQTTGQVSDAHPVPFQPAGWAFSIWSVIYGLLAIFVIYSFFPTGRRNARIQAVGPLFLIANIANISWLFLWHWERFQGSLIALVVLLGALAAIYLVLRTVRRGASGMSTLQRVIVALPFSVYLGWVFIATIANLEVWMREGGWDGGMFGLRGWTVIFLLVGIIVAGGIAFFAHDAAVPAVFVWAYLGIAQRQWGEDMLLSILAIVLVVAAAALTAMASILSFDNRSGPRMETPAIGSFWRRGSSGERTGP